MVGCQDCIHYEVCDYRDPARYETIQELKNDCRHCIPTADVVPSVDAILPASALFTLAQIEEKRKMLMLKHDAELTLNLLSEIKKEAHNKAVHPCGCKIDPYISLKVLDGIIQKYINEYYEEG